MPQQASPWPRISHLPRAELEALQRAELRRYVTQELYPFSAHYRKMFDAAGVKPTDIREVADLARLPFTTKKDLLEAQIDPERKRDFVLIPSPTAIKRHWPLRRKLGLLFGGQAAKDGVAFDYTPNFLTFTTGRSSEPVGFAYTPHDLERMGEIGGRMLDVHAIHDRQARILNMFPFAPHLAFWQVTFAGFRTGRLILPTGGGKLMGTAGNLKMAERMKPTVMLGVPGFVYHLLREAAERRADLSAVKLVILGAEKVTPGLKLKMAEALATCGARDVVISGTYGFTEARMAFGECPAAYEESPGYHTYPDLGVFEVIDPVSGKVLGEGETGELVFTPLGGHGTVVCRYRTGDLAVGGISYEPCKWCGRSVPRISNELRRASDQKDLDLTKIKGTLVDLSHIGTVVSGIAEVEEWQVVLKKIHDDPHELDEFVLRLSLEAGADPVASEKKIRQMIVDATEVSPNRIEFHSTKEMLELIGMETEMKEKRFLDLRPK
ncbi:MAG: phenylacetate--CoA ligase family protein [Planctomycetes bacterium]|nr:phenylacetate--CoA ligase family protein [Planctomycetota bacterium]